jgi:hypothetical protein
MLYSRAPAVPARTPKFAFAGISSCNASPVAVLEMEGNSGKLTEAAAPLLQNPASQPHSKPLYNH